MPTLLSNETITVALPPGYSLTVTAAAASSGTVERLPDSEGDSLKGYDQIAASTSRGYGPFRAGVERYRIRCIGGTLTYTQSDNLEENGVQYETPLTGTTVTVADNMRTLIVDPAGTIATLTINMPANPTDKQRVSICFDAVVTTLTMAATGFTLKNALTASTAASFATWEFRAADLTWWRVS